MEAAEKQILLVEDNRADATILRETLADVCPGEFKVVWAETLAKALDGLRKDRFDAILLDLSLPDSHGAATFERVLEVAPAVPVVILSGAIDEHVAAGAVRQGAQDYLVKGETDGRSVSRAIRYAIDRKTIEEALREAHDELERKVRERTRELHKANQTLRVISDCNEVLIRAADEESLIRDTCRIIVDLGGYRMAWVGYPEADEARTVRPVASVGFEDGYLGKARITWADTALGRGPTGTCLRTGEVRIGRNFDTDPDLAPWREDALERGFGSSIAIPLKDGGKVFGALTLYATDSDFFDETQAALLRELADDLAFGIVALRARMALVRSQALAERRSEQLRALALQLTEAEQAERRRLARILHDHLQQLLVGAKFGVGALKVKVRGKALHDTLRQLSETLDEAIKASRTLTAELSPPILHEKGLVAGLEWLVRQMEEKHHLTVRLRADGFPDLGSDHLRTFLFEAVRELLFNAVKHAGAAEAEVRLAKVGDDAVGIVVEDKGKGFAPELLEAREGQTGGFGLFSIRERLAYLGGSLEVESAPGQGSRFTLLAPIHAARGFARPDQAAEPAQGDDGEAAPPALFPAGQKIRVLLADDHAVLRQGLAAILADQPDIELVGQASDGEMAVDMARQLQPDVVIMDVTMPRLNGVEATRLIAGEMPEVRVIGLSLHEPADMTASMREAGAHAYLNKGGPAEELIAAIRAS